MSEVVRRLGGDRGAVMRLRLAEPFVAIARDRHRGLHVGERGIERQCTLRARLDEPRQRVGRVGDVMPYTSYANASAAYAWANVGSRAAAVESSPVHPEAATIRDGQAVAS